MCYKKWKDVKSYLDMFQTDEQELLSLIQQYYDVFEQNKKQRQTKDDEIKHS